MKITRRDAPGRCRLADVFVPEGDHQRWHRRLVGVQRKFWQHRPIGRDPGAGADADRKDPRRFEQMTQHLHVLTRQSRGGMNQQAIAAIENALLDVAGKAYGVPV